MSAAARARALPFPDVREVSLAQATAAFPAAINRAAIVCCHSRCTAQFPREETPSRTKSTNCGPVLGLRSFSLTLFASFCLAGCTAIDEVTILTKGEALLAYAPEPRLIPPAESQNGAPSTKDNVQGGGT